MAERTEQVHSGYHGYFQPPYSLFNTKSGNGGSLYCISDAYSNVLVIIPLIPNFYVDVMTLMKNMTYRSVYFIVPDIGVRFVSDYVNSWYYIKKYLGRECKLFSYYMPENVVSEEFLADINRNLEEAQAIVFGRSRTQITSMNFQLSRMLVNTAAPYACDVIVNDTNGNKFFATEMNERKAQWLYSIREKFDEIHIPYIQGTYPTMTYNELMREYPAFVKQFRVNRFSSYDEYMESKIRNVKIGGLF